jgi:hypothetical protein
MWFDVFSGSTIVAIIQNCGEEEYQNVGLKLVASKSETINGYVSAALTLNVNAANAVKA